MNKIQVLRYDRWSDKSGPLWIKSNETMKEGSIPVCKCGAQRKFEFQVRAGGLFMLEEIEDIYIYI
jgi:hypothetical protein